MVTHVPNLASSFPFFRVSHSRTIALAWIEPWEVDGATFRQSLKRGTNKALEEKERGIHAIYFLLLFHFAFYLLLSALRGQVVLGLRLLHSY